jgi:hypothetical protein
VRAHSAGRSRTFPYEVSRIGALRLMRDAPRKNPRDYRKEEWIACDVDPRKVDAIARQHARGRFFVCAMIAEGDPDEPMRSAYKALGYRLLATEGFFVQRMKRIPMAPSSVLVERVRTPDLAAQLGENHSYPADFKQFAWRRRSVPAIRGTRWRGLCWARAQRRSCGSDVVRRHVCSAFAPASRHWPGVAVKNVAGRPGLWLEVLGADRESHRCALVSSRGL